MLLERSDAMLNLHSDPNIVLGPCKCHPTECLLKNGDPLANKKARMAPASATNLETTDNAPPHHAKEKNLGCVPDSTHGSDDSTSDRAPPQAIEVDYSDSDDDDIMSIGGEVTEEDDEAGLGKFVDKTVSFNTLTESLDCLKKEWDAPIYAFFGPLPSIEYISGCKVHVF